jgi:hypothetical protein
MNAHPFVTRVAVHARDIAFGIVKTHQSLHVRDRQKCRFDRIFQFGGVSSKRLNLHERAQQWATSANLDLSIPPHL